MAPDHMLIEATRTLRRLALYVALAESIDGARLLTTDRKLANAASGRVDVIAL